jgi:hypothetical protein
MALTAISRSNSGQANSRASSTPLYYYTTADKMPRFQSLIAMKAPMSCSVKGKEMLM